MTNPFSPEELARTKPVAEIKSTFEKNYGGSTIDGLLFHANKKITMAQTACQQADTLASMGNMKGAGDACLVASKYYFTARDYFEQASRTDKGNRSVYLQMAGDAFNQSLICTEHAKSYYQAIDAKNAPLDVTVPDRFAETFTKGAVDPDCKTCKGTGKIKGGNVDCPTCVQKDK